MRYLIVTYLLLISLWSSAQQSADELQGTISYVTSQSVYVKFERTDAINEGDTLKLRVADSWQPCLLVKNKSSVSVVCVPLNNCVLVKDTKVMFKPAMVPVEELNEPFESGPKPEDESVKRERFHGRISAASFSNITDNKSPSHRTMYRMNFNADHIGESKFSFETYLNFRQLYLPPEKQDIQKSTFYNVYNAAVTYRPDSTMYITLGRKINNKASSLGAIDGLQIEKYFGRFFTGVIAGFRPDFINYGLNLNLPEFGLYTGLETKAESFTSKTTLGALQQNNGGAVDRRYLYFQHTGTIQQKLTLFTSSELDVFNVVHGETTNDYRLTNFYTSLNYRLSKKIDFNVSYDSRKQIMYYETFSSDIERLLDDDQSRQGVRARIGLRPFKHTSMGVSVGKRFQSSNQNQSDNINGYITYAQLPGIGSRLSLNYNLNWSSYLLSEVISLRLTQGFFDKKLNADFYVRKVNYTYYSQSDLPSENTGQYYYGINLMQRCSPTISFSILGEMSTYQDVTSYRVNLRLNKRFDSKKKRKSRKEVEPDPNAAWKF
ncbi:MAG: hypothetical protein K1X54_10340 [Flavobacteriales bacterium]|nr:hypothetical protein [Flavobacteriales bacterium]